MCSYHEHVEPPSVLSEQTDEIYNDKLYHLLEHISQKMHPLYRKEKYHVCALYNVKTGKIYLGENKMFDYRSYPISIHAEMDALNKIPRQRNQKQRAVYDVLVIRISPSGKLGLSRPCLHCIQSLQENEYIKVRHVYYSSRNGAIIREKLEEMRDSKYTIISSGYLYRKHKQHNLEFRVCGLYSDTDKYEFYYRI